MTECIDLYKKTLRKNLRCSGAVQKRLMKKFDLSLDNFLDDTPSPGMEAIHSAFGPPDEMAQLLMADVTDKEAAQYRIRNITLRTTAAVIGGLLLAASIYIFYFKEQNVTYDNSVEIDNVFAVEAFVVEDGSGSVD